MSEIPEIKVVTSDANQILGTEIFPEYEYIEVPVDKIANDSFIAAVAQSTEVDSEPTMSKWLISEFSSLTKLSHTLDREIGFDLIVSPEGELFISAEKKFANRNSIEGTFLTTLNILEGFEVVAHGHTHVKNNTEGLAGFSNAPGGDWDQIIVRGDNFLNYVCTSQGGIYITHRPAGRIEEIVSRYINDERTDLADEEYEKQYYAYLAHIVDGVGNTDEMITFSGDDNNKRIEINIRMAEYFGFNLYRVDTDTGEVHKLERPKEDN